MPERTLEVQEAVAARPAPLPRRGAAMSSLGVALPSAVVANAPIAERLGVDDHWIVKRIGVRERRVLGPGERLEDLAVRASEQALARAGLDASELDLVLVGTYTSDEILPHSAPLVADSIGARNASAYDIGAACAGFIAAASLATGQIESGRADAVLVVGAEAMSRHLDMDDRRTAALFGDGAGAVVMTAVDPPGGMGACVMHADANSRETVFMTRAGMQLHMEGQQTFVYAVDYISQATEEVLEAAGLTLDDIDLFVYHQANARIIRAVGARLGLPGERVVDCVALTGNTASASIPIALATAESEGRLRPGTRVLMGAIGAGFVWGAAIFEWGLPGG